MPSPNSGWIWHRHETLYGELLAITGGKERLRHYAARYAPGLAAGAGFDDLIQRLHATKTAHYVRRVTPGICPCAPASPR